jgi:hypothetical protein
MKLDNRVLSRTNARELTVEEVGQVGGALITIPSSPCTAPPLYPTADGPRLDCPQ